MGCARGGGDGRRRLRLRGGDGYGVDLVHFGRHLRRLLDGHGQHERRDGFRELIGLHERREFRREHGERDEQRRQRRRHCGQLRDHLRRVDELHDERRFHVLGDGRQYRRNDGRQLGRGKHVERRIHRRIDQRHEHQHDGDDLRRGALRG
jgi:hypothetical protein